MFGGQLLSVAGAQVYTIYRALVSNTVTLGDCLVVLNSISAISQDVQSIGGTISYMQRICYAYQDWRDFIERKDRVDGNADGEEARRAI